MVTIKVSLVLLLIMAESDTKQRIKQAANDLVMQYGIRSVSMDDIAAKLGISKKTIYLYFKDKDEILHELMEMGFKYMGSYMQHIQDTNPVNRIFLTGEAYIKFGLENKDWYELMFNSIKPINHIINCGSDWNEGLNMFSFLIKNCEEAIKQTNLKNVEANILALQLWSSVHGMVNLYHSERLCIVLDENPNVLINKTLKSMINSIFNHN